MKWKLEKVKIENNTKIILTFFGGWGWRRKRQSFGNRSM